jgi:hypothetical protein
MTDSGSDENLGSQWEEADNRGDKVNPNLEDVKNDELDHRDGQDDEDGRSDSDSDLATPKHFQYSWEGENWTMLLSRLPALEMLRFQTPAPILPRSLVLRERSPACEKELIQSWASYLPSLTRVYLRYGYGDDNHCDLEATGFGRDEVYVKDTSFGPAGEWTHYRFKSLIAQAGAGPAPGVLPLNMTSLLQEDLES